MNTTPYWQVTIQFVTEDPESGKVKRIKEDWLVDAQSATEAEAKTLKHFEGTLGEYEVIKAVQSRILGLII